MRTKLSKLLSLLLCLVMVVGLFPVSVMANDLSGIDWEFDLTDMSNVTIEESTDEIAKEQLLLHECDYAIVSDAVNYTDFNYEFLFHAPYGIFVNETHPLASKKSLTFKDIENEKLIGKTQKLKYYMQYIKDIENLDANFVMELTNNGKSRNLIKNNVAIAVAWDYTIFSDVEDGVVFRPVLDMGKGMDVYFVENKNYSYSPKQILLKEYLLNWFSNQRK